MDFFKKLAGVLTGIEPLLEVAAGLVFPGSQVAVMAVKYGVGMIGDAEKAIGDGNGPVKLAYVNKAANDFVAGYKAAGGEITVNGQEINVEPLMTTVVNSIIAGTKALGVQYDETPDPVNQKLDGATGTAQG